MRRWRRTTACERALQWVSLGLDEELDELEWAALARHLGRCDQCASLSAELAGLTLLLREAEIVAPAAPAVRVEARTGRSRARRVALAGSLAAVVAILGARYAGPSESVAGSNPLRFQTTAERLIYAYNQQQRAEPSDVGHLAPASAVPLQISLAARSGA